MWVDVWVWVDRWVDKYVDGQWVGGLTNKWIDGQTKGWTGDARRTVQIPVLRKGTDPAFPTAQKHSTGHGLSRLIITVCELVPAAGEPWALPEARGMPMLGQGMRLEQA